MIFATVLLLLTTAYVIMSKTENSNQRRLEEELHSQRAADKEAKDLMLAINREEAMKNATTVINNRGLWVAMQEDARLTQTFLDQLVALHQRNLSGETSLLHGDSAVFAANPTEHVVLFTDFQNQLLASTVEIQKWRTQLKSIEDQTTKMLTLVQISETPPAEHSQYIEKARGEIQVLITKMRACDAFMTKRIAERSTAEKNGISLQNYIAETHMKAEVVAAQALEAELLRLRNDENEKIRKIVLETEMKKLAVEKQMAENRLKAVTERLEREKAEQDSALAMEKAEAEAAAKILAEDRALKADMRAVEKLLYQFTAKGNKQLLPSGNLEPVSEPTAISLSATTLTKLSWSR